MIPNGSAPLTKQEAVDYARHCRYSNGGTWYVTRNARAKALTVINSKLYRRKIHGIVVAIIGTA